MLPVLSRLNRSATGFIRCFESLASSLLNSSFCMMAGVDSGTGGALHDVTATFALQEATVESTALNEYLPHNRHKGCSNSDQIRHSSFYSSGCALAQRLRSVYKSGMSSLFPTFLSQPPFLSPPFRTLLALERHLNPAIGCLGSAMSSSAGSGEARPPHAILCIFS